MADQTVAEKMSGLQVNDGKKVTHKVRPVVRFMSSHLSHLKHGANVTATVL